MVDGNAFLSAMDKKARLLAPAARQPLHRTRS
jgi:hypothetical protein